MWFLRQEGAEEQTDSRGRGPTKAVSVIRRKELSSTSTTLCKAGIFRPTREVSHALLSKREEDGRCLCPMQEQQASPELPTERMYRRAPRLSRVEKASSRRYVSNEESL